MRLSKNPILLSALFGFSSLISLVQGAATGTSTGVNCTAINDDEDKFEVCYQATHTASSGISMDENGTVLPAQQSYSYSYDIVDSETELPIGLLISMFRSGEYDVDKDIDRTNCTSVDVNGEMCNSCSYCGDETFSADCTNLPNGRMVECESSSPLFFPLTEDALIIGTDPSECTEINDNGNKFEVCFNTTLTGISGISMDENGTVLPAQQSYSYSYDIVDSATDLPLGLLISMSRSGEVDGDIDRTNCTSVDINGEMCNSCSYCGDETFSADCTNVPDGRLVECESSSPLFFPLTEDALIVGLAPFECTEINDDGNTFEVCFNATLTGISGISMDENGTVLPAQQSYSYSYDIVDSATELPLGLLISMSHSGEVDGDIDRTNCTSVDINGEICSSCSYCGDEKFSADCTNIPNGRVVECEPSSPLFFPLTEDALIVGTNPSECTEINADGDVFEVCYKTALTGISGISMDENGTALPAQQSFSYSYDIVDSATDLPLGLLISMSRSGEVDGDIDRTNCTSVDINGDVCNSCSYCGDEKFSADCTNIPNGRMVKCESSMPLFFPLTEESLSTGDTINGVNCTNKSVQMEYVSTSSDTDLINVTLCHDSTAEAASSISMYENGTEAPAYQTYSYSTNIYSVEGTTLPDVVKVTVARSGEVDVDTGVDRTQCDSIVVNGEECNTCTYCGDDTYSADCTNLLYGRLMEECELVGPTLMPFAVNALLEQLDNPNDILPPPIGDQRPIQPKYVQIVLGLVKLLSQLFLLSPTKMK